MGARHSFIVGKEQRSTLSSATWVGRRGVYGFRRSSYGDVVKLWARRQAVVPLKNQTLIVFARIQVDLIVCVRSSHQDRKYGAPLILGPVDVDGIVVGPLAIVLLCRKDHEEKIGRASCRARV